MAKVTVVDTVVGYLRDRKLDPKVEVGGGNAKVRFVVEGRACLCVCTRKPSDRRAYLNALSDVKRLIRDAGGCS